MYKIGEEDKTEEENETTNKKELTPGHLFIIASPLLFDIMPQFSYADI
jgi:hypothetical protein